MRISLRFINKLPLLLLAMTISSHGLAETALEKIERTDTITIGYRTASLPFSYLSPKKKPIGYSIDICSRIVDEIETRLGKKIAVNYVKVTSSDRIPKLVKGEIDMECGSTTNNTKRRKQVAFLPATYFTGTKLLIKNYTGINSINDLDGKIIAITKGTTTIQDVIKAAGEANIAIKIQPVKDHAEGFLLVALDRVAAYASDDILLYSLRKRAMIPEDYEIIGDFLSNDRYGIMIRRGEPELLEIGKATIKNMIRSGEIEKRYQFWFSPLRVPMSKPLKEHFKKLAG